MLGTLIRTVRKVCYSYPEIREDTPGCGQFADLKVALLTDYLTSLNLSYECRVRCLTRSNFRTVLREWRPDFVFVESAFHGYRWDWSYCLPKQSPVFGRYTLKDFRALAATARELHIPLVFWNKDDGVFFEAFIEVAKLCDYRYTADENSVPRYREALSNMKDASGNSSHAGLLMMAYQPAIHSFNGFNFTKKSMCFVGSYYRKILNSRRATMDAIFKTCESQSLPLDIYDRNSSRLSRFYEFRYPSFSHVTVHNAVPYQKTADLYHEYNVSLNINSVTDSPTMFSRRMLEIMGSGGIMATNPSRAVNALFKDYCTVIGSEEEARDVLPAMVADTSPELLEKAEAGYRFVRENFTWEKRFTELAEDGVF